MCSQIDARTRDNPEAAMVHQSSSNLPMPDCQTYQNAEAWLWPKGDDVKTIYAMPTPLLKVGEFKRKESGELPGFDSEGHRAFMRSLG